MVSEKPTSTIVTKLLLQPPSMFCFKNTEKWPRWKRRFEQFRLVSGLTEQGEERRVSTLLYYLGEEAEQILDTTRIFVDNRKSYKKVIEEFDNYFKVRKNIIFEHAQFNR